MLRVSGWIDWTFSPPLLWKGEVSYVMMTEPLDGAPTKMIKKFEKYLKFELD